MRKKFFTLPDGREAGLYRLQLADGFGADITDFGGCVTAIRTPDASGKLRDVALGWKDPADYLTNPGYLGALIGRVPNRISGGRFVLDGVTYQMVLNDNGCCTLHGGFGFSHRLWRVETATDSALTLTLFSPHGDAGFPGDLFVRASYRITACHTLELEISAECDRPTAADFTSHIYFNLDGEDSGVCDRHHIAVNAAEVTEVDDRLLPTGKLRAVEGTRYDLRRGKSFREIFAEYEPGFDDNFVLAHEDHHYQENAAVATGGASGIRLAVHTSRPGIQLYMGNFLSGPGKSGEYPRHGAFCLETQGWPDSVNHPDFPSIRVEPGRPFHGITRYQFSVK